MEEIEEEYFNFRGPSKSSRKRDSTAMQDLGAELLELSDDQLERLELPDALLEAVRVGQSSPHMAGCKGNGSTLAS